MADLKKAQEIKIRKITQLYYSRPDIQKAMYEFCMNREVSPRYFEGFGKRPDCFQYPTDILNLAKNGATSFHCSEEIWSDPLQISTDMNEKQITELRKGWDLLIDIDCAHGMEFSILAAKSIIDSLNHHGVKNVGIKFSGSKGFHILVPWKAFPKEINGMPTANLFPEIPRKVVSYLRYYSEKIMSSLLPEDFEKKFGEKSIRKGVKCKNCNEIATAYEQVELYCPFCRIGEIRRFEKGGQKEKYFCPECKRKLEFINPREFHECSKCRQNSLKNPTNFNEAVIESDLYELMGLDLVLVSPRHLFRAPYSLHEKTALASVVLTREQLENFQKERDADPLRIKIRNFTPNSEENEAAELVMQALDWAKSVGFGEENGIKATGKYAEYKPIKLDGLTEEHFPPCIKKILNGVTDGRKRALFAIMNLFRSIGMEKEELEKKIYEWNDKNEVPLKKGYINAQLIWAYRRKPIMPPNCKEFYRGIGICSPDNICSSIKNPVNYVIKKNLGNKKDKFKK